MLHDEFQFGRHASSRVINLAVLRGETRKNYRPRRVHCLSKKLHIPEQAKMAQQGKRRHILCVAFPAYGHMIPLLALARKIAVYHDVTFAVSKDQLDELKRREILKDDDAHIKLYGIEDGFFGDFEDPTNMPLMEKIFGQVMGGVGKFMMEIPTHTQPARPDFGIQRPVDVVITGTRKNLSS